MMDAANDMSVTSLLPDALSRSHRGAATGVCRAFYVLCLQALLTYVTFVQQTMTV
jgi:hypothetical protein